MERTYPPPREYVSLARLWRDLFAALLIATILAIFTRTFIVQAFRIPTGSMEPGLLIGDHILVNKFIYGGDRLGSPAQALLPMRLLPMRLLPMRHVRRGDVVVFASPRDPSRDFIKRCLAMPGETLEIGVSGLRVDHHLLDETGYAAVAGDDFGPFQVPEDHLFCLGDHRHLSNDSRSWGPVPVDHLKGRAFMIYWSVATTESNAEELETWGKMIFSLRGYARWLLHSRWQRSLKLVR